MGLTNKLVYLVLLILNICCHKSIIFSLNTPITNEKDEYFYSHCRSGNVTVIKEYLEHGFNVHSRDNKGNTGIIIAAGRGHVPVIQLLLKYNANPEDSTLIGIFEGKTSLMWACSQGRLEVVDFYIRNGVVDPHRVSDKGVFAGKNALMWASSQGKTNVVNLLLAIGINFEYTSSTGNFRGKNALMWACSQGREETVKVLLEAGTNVNAIDIDGVNALMWASGSEAADQDNRVRQGLQLERATKGHVKVVQQLLKYGAYPDMRDKDGITAIMFASYHGHVNVVKVLLNTGANADYMSREGKTAIQLARNSGHEESVQAILDGPTFLKADLDELKEMTACGWLVSVLRSPRGTGILRQAEYKNSTYEPIYSIHSKNIACQGLYKHGLGYTMYDLLIILHGSYHINDIINRLEINEYASQIRAKLQLIFLYKKFKIELENITNYINHNILQISIKQDIDGNNNCVNNQNEI